MQRACTQAYGRRLCSAVLFGLGMTARGAIKGQERRPTWTQRRDRADQPHRPVAMRTERGVGLGHGEYVVS